jgi:Flp pilus assembly protein TadG
MPRLRPRSWRPRRGASAVEFAILLPFLCSIFVVTVDYARIFYFSLTVANCARNGALYGSADSTHAQDTAGIQAAAQADASNLTLSQLGVTSATDSSTSPTYVTVTVSYPVTTITSYPGIPGQTTIKRTVRMSVVPATPTFN